MWFFGWSWAMWFFGWSWARSVCGDGCETTVVMAISHPTKQSRLRRAAAPAPKRTPAPPPPCPSCPRNTTNTHTHTHGNLMHTGPLSSTHAHMSDTLSDGARSEKRQSSLNFKVCEGSRRATYVFERKRICRTLGAQRGVSSGSAMNNLECTPSGEPVVK